MFLAEDSRPDNRSGGGITLNWVVGINDQFALHNLYRFYRDNWKISSHTFDWELNYKPTAKFKSAFKFRWYKQSAADFYRGGSNENARFNASEFASSDERLGDFNASTLSLGLGYKVASALWFDVSVERYSQSNGFMANSAIAGFTQYF